MEWQLDSACLDTDPELFFQSELVEAAKEICLTCPVKTLCLQYAFEIDATDGVFAGLTAKERLQLSKKLTTINKGNNK
jgi:WhiB family redox-sensing transcriptional regulator